MNVMKTFDRLSVSGTVGGPLSSLPLWKEFYKKRKKKSGASKKLKIMGFPQITHFTRFGKPYTNMIKRKDFL